MSMAEYFTKMLNRAIIQVWVQSSPVWFDPVQSGQSSPVWSNPVAWMESGWIR